jgi:hypothetical protein
MKTLSKGLAAFYFRQKLFGSLFAFIASGARHCPHDGSRSRRARNLTARKFNPVLRIKPFEFSAEAARKQIFHFHTENAGNDEQFQIGNPALLVFQNRHRFATGVPAQQLKFDGQIILRPVLALAEFPHLGADDIQLCRRFFDACTLAAEGAQSWRLYLTLNENFYLDVV